MSRKKKQPTRQNWEKRVLAAHHHMLGDTQQAISEIVGVRRETVNRWMQDEERWAEAIAEARGRRGAKWADEMDVHSERTLLTSVKRNPMVAQWWKERTDSRLTPKSKHEHTGKDGKPIEHAATVTIYVPDNGRGS